MLRALPLLATVAAIAVGLSPLIAGADVNPLDACAAQSSRTALVCQSGSCIAVSPRTVCLAARRTPAYTRIAAPRAITLEEQGRQQLDALIAGIQ